MSRKFVLVLAFMLCLSFLVIEVEGDFGPHPPPLGAVFGSTPSVDGSIGNSEWSDADSRSFNQTDVFVKQDGRNLYIALNVTDAPLMHVEEDCAQILLDVDFDGGLTLQPDDVGLAVLRNGTLIEGNVTGGAWTFVNVVGWTAAVSSTSDMWQVEFNVTYSKIDVFAGVYKDIGVSIGCAYYPEEGSPTWVCWPPNTYSDMTFNPSSWGAITSVGYNWIPEFTQFLVLPTLMIGTMLAVVVYKRKRTVQDRAFH